MQFGKKWFVGACCPWGNSCEHEHGLIEQVVMLGKTAINSHYADEQQRQQRQLETFTIKTLLKLSVVHQHF